MNYIIRPTKSYSIISKCPSCNSTQRYYSSEKFRVNANKKRIDIWLIYKCAKCGNTKNITIYERENIQKIDPLLLQKFLENDATLAFIISTDSSIFKKNGLRNLEGAYELVIEGPQEDQNPKICIIENPSHMHLKTVAVLARILNKTHSFIKAEIKNGHIEIESDYLTELNHIRLAVGLRGELDDDN